MWKTSILLFFLFFLNFVFSQNKKETDTIYVYEEVIIRDTIYIERPLSKVDKVLVTPEKKGKKSQITITQNNKKTNITVDSLEIKGKKNDFSSNWEFGSKLNLGLNSNTLFKEFNAENQFIIGIGVFVRKTIFHANFSIGTGIESSITINPSEINNASSDSFLNGYYFTEDATPKLFQSINSKGFQFQIPIQFYWKIKNFTPSVGVFGNLSSYESKFIGSSGSTPLTFDETQTFSAKTISFGYLFQLEYAFSKKWSLGTNYSYSNAKNIVFQRKNESFSVSKRINQNNFGMLLFYHF